jgi:CheY-like chemotaxis protein/phosphoribosyl 1,2-cyclic phosphodiesterase
MRVRFWGTRGSLAKPGPTTLRYGGNTACVEVHTAGGTLIVLDCGTGAHGLGQALRTSGVSPLHGHLLITHTHWDHIQGFPFFAPLFDATNTWDIYAPGGLGQHLEETLSGQMQYTYFPLTLDQLGATIRYHDLREGPFEPGGVPAIARYLNHPGLTLGYRLEVGGVTLVYATDHEPHVPPRADPASPTRAASQALPVHAGDQGHLRFLAGADLVIHDAQYTLAEYAQKIGWGHSPLEYVVDMAMAAQVKRLALFHHDPLRDDETLERVVDACRQRVQAADSRLEVFAAAEGQEIELPESAIIAPSRSGMVDIGEPARMEPEAPAAQTVLIVDDDPDIVDVLTLALAPEGYRLLTAYDGSAALRIARAERPALILLDWLMPGCDGLEVCRVLRADSDPQLRTVPVVVLTAQTEDEHIATAFAAGATDYLTKPFKLPYIRSRVRSWLLRARRDAPAGTP